MGLKNLLSPVEILAIQPSKTKFASLGPSVDSFRRPEKKNKAASDVPAVSAVMKDNGQNGKNLKKNELELSQSYSNSRSDRMDMQNSLKDLSQFHVHRFERIEAIYI